MSVNVDRPLPGKLRMRTAAHVRGKIAYYGTTPTAVARKLGRSAVWISKRMNGHQAIDVDDLEAIAAVLGIEPTELLPRGEATPGYATHHPMVGSSRPGDGRPGGRPAGPRGPSGPSRTSRVRNPVAA
jgi:hypothetical protein